MERRSGHTGFFFADAVQRLDSFFEYTKRQCTNIFSGGGGNKPVSPQDAPGAIIQAELDQWFNHMHWLAEGDPVKLKVVGEMPSIEFFLLLDKKIAETKKELARVRKNGTHKSK